MYCSLMFPFSVLGVMTQGVAHLIGSQISWALYLTNKHTPPLLKTTAAQIRSRDEDCMVLKEGTSKSKSKNMSTLTGGTTTTGKHRASRHHAAAKLHLQGIFANWTASCTGPLAQQPAICCNTQLAEDKVHKHQ